MQAPKRVLTAMGAIALLVLAGCAGEPDPDADGDETPVITAPPPTSAPEEPEEPEEPEFPEFDDVDTSDWRLMEAEDGQGA